MATQFDFKTQFGCLFDKVLRNAVDSLAKIAQYRKKQKTIAKIYRRPSKNLKEKQKVNCVRNEVMEVRTTIDSKFKNIFDENATIKKENPHFNKPIDKTDIEPVFTCLPTPSPTESESSLSSIQTTKIKVSQIRKRPNGEMVDTGCLKNSRLEEEHSLGKVAIDYENQKLLKKIHVESTKPNLTDVPVPGIKADMLSDTLQYGNKLHARKEDLIARHHTQKVNASSLKLTVPQVVPKRANIKTPKFLLVLVRHKNKVEDLLNLTGSYVNKMEFNCINAVMKEILLARSKPVKGSYSDEAEATKILEFHISYLKRKREEYQKTFDSKCRDNFRWTCAALKRLLEVLNCVKVDSHITFDDPVKVKC